MRILFSCFYDIQHTGTLLLASYMQELGHEVHILKLKRGQRAKPIPFEDLNEEDDGGYYKFTNYTLVSSMTTMSPVTECEFSLFREVISRFQPDLICLSNRTPLNYLLPDVIKAARDAAPGVPIACGGFGPTLNPEIPLSIGADFVVLGEGEAALRELVAMIESGKADWQAIRNLVWMQDGNMIRNPLRPLVTELDAYPHPFCDDSRITIIENNRASEPAASDKDWYGVLSSRGCLYRCSYCSGGNARALYLKEGLKAPVMRNRPIASILDELEIAKERGYRNVQFLDEYIVRPIHELITFFKEYKKRIDLPFFANLNAAQLLASEEYFNAVVEAGPNNYAFGVQSGCERFTKEVYNRKNDNKVFLTVMRKFHERGIFGTWHYIGGNILATQEAFEKTLEFAARTPFDPMGIADCVAHCFYFTPFPGSPITETHPELYEKRYSLRIWYYEAALLQLRHMVSTEEFQNIYSDPYYKENPRELGVLLRTVKEDKYLAALHKAIRDMEGKEVYFYGCGEVYRFKKHLFSGAKPKYMLVDKGFEQPEAVDGIPVKTPDEVLSCGDETPVVIFSKAAVIIARRLRRQYGMHKNLVLCPNR